MTPLVLASGNAGKLAEFRDLLRGLEFDVRPQSEFGVTDADETGLTFIENAILKARHAAAATNMAALGDDSGLCVDALGGAPGLYSARYAGSHGNSSANIDTLLNELRDVDTAHRCARFVCVLALLRHAEDPMPLVAQAHWEGHILQAPQGDGGFGYDPVFFSPAHGCSAADLDAETKNRASHRGQALMQLKELLKGTR